VHFWLKVVGLFFDFLFSRPSSGIIFVALMKQHVLGDPLFTFQWVGVVFNVVSVFLVGGTAILNESSGSKEDDGSGQALVGVLLVMLGAVVQAMQFVFEEKVMTMVSCDGNLTCPSYEAAALTLSPGYPFASIAFDWNGRFVGDDTMCRCGLPFSILSARGRPRFI
jgi:drug/metabolite transporter (DMT)-like permease